ncbi:MAG: hypothetical protein WD068_02675 [Candidatus Babeliales bacterium]
MKKSALKKIIALSGCLNILLIQVTTPQANEIASPDQATNLSIHFITKLYPNRNLDQICMYELIDVLNKLKDSFFDTTGNQESFSIHIARLVGFKAIMRQKIDHELNLKIDFEKYNTEYKTFLGATITFEKFKSFLEGLYTNFNTLCTDLMDKKARSPLFVGNAFVRFHNRLPKDLTAQFEKQEGTTINATQALLAIRTRLKK